MIGSWGTVLWLAAGLSAALLLLGSVLFLVGWLGQESDTRRDLPQNDDW